MLLVWSIAVVVAVYWAIPEVLLHYAHLGVLARPEVGADAICLTFDDGPGAATEAVREVLARHGAKATFFAVAREAERDPDALRRLRADGHEIASHGRVHRSAWLLGPIASFLQVQRARQAIAAITGDPPRRFRPPWGQFNVAVLWAARRCRQEIALWSYDPGDWRLAVDPQALAGRILAHLRPGQIFLLHDAGGDGRLHTARALDIALPEIRRRGYRLCTLSELSEVTPAPLPAWRRALRAVWGIWEATFERMNRIERIGDERSILRIGIVSYRGLPHTLRNGRRVEPGDRVAELHFRNPRIAVLGAIRAVKAMHRTMRDLAQMLETDPKLQDIDVLFGVSVIFRGPERLGFEVVDMDFNRWRRFFTGLYLRWVMTVYHPEGARRLEQRRDQLEPKGIFISRAEVLARYGPAAQARGEER